jgi:arylsulfatase
MRSIANFNTGYPHMTGRISENATTMGEVLREVGYTTFALGKWHLCPMDEASAAGPYDAWPLQRGFDRFYGFLDGETDQFAPDLVYDNHRVDPAATAAEGYHLSEDLVDKAIEFIHDTVSIRPDRPFFTYLAFGATHAPHQAPEEYLARHRGKYDEGWDVARERRLERQIAMGIVPPRTQLPPRNDFVFPWEDIPSEQKPLFIRLMAAYAAMLEHFDDHLARLIHQLEVSGQLENTVVMVMSDNGASQEGGPFGFVNAMGPFNLIAEPIEEKIAKINDIGGPDTHSNFPWGWAMVANTPLKRYTQNTHSGGIQIGRAHV